MPDREQWLRLAVDEGLSVAELRRRIRGPVKAVKRWTVAELSERLAAWDGGGSAEHQACMDFLEWLEGAGE